uniref:Reverse transcriptase domain-containing protein n=1 Tax=Megaselia scalaris TaxID=36166 RepID=T1GYE3_MEGSC
NCGSHWFQESKSAFSSKISCAKREELAQTDNVSPFLAISARSGVIYIEYAEGIAILVQDKFPNTLSKLLSQALRIVKAWTIENRLGVNANKSNLVMFTRRHTMVDFKKPKLDRTMLKIKQKAKKLGIILDKKLSWRSSKEKRRFLGSKWVLRRT